MAATLSLAGQMRRKKAEGYSVSAIARLFDVSYHHAYGAVITHADAEDTQLSSTPAGPRREPASPEVAGLTDEELFVFINTIGKKGLTARKAATDELDRRDPSGAWLDAFDKWVSRQ